MSNNFNLREEEQAEFDPLSKEVKARLQHIDPRIDPLKLRELIVTNLLSGRSLAEMSPGERKVLDFRVRLEYEWDLDRHIQRLLTPMDRQSDSQARDILMRAKEVDYSGVEFAEDGDELEDGNLAVLLPEVDRPIARGGLTELHVKAAEGDLAAVKELVERRGARPDSKDSYGLTPLERAQMMGQVDVATYLRNTPS